MDKRILKKISSKIKLYTGFLPENSLEFFLCPKYLIYSLFILYCTTKFGNLTRKKASGLMVLDFDDFNTLDEAKEFKKNIKSDNL